MKYRKIKKALTKQEALQKIEIAKMQMQNCQEAIDTWQKEKPVGIIACVIVSEFGSVEKAIEVNTQKINWCNEIINDLLSIIKEERYKATDGDRGVMDFESDAKVDKKEQTQNDLF